MHCTFDISFSSFSQGNASTVNDILSASKCTEFQSFSTYPCETVCLHSKHLETGNAKIHTDAAQARVTSVAFFTYTCIVTTIFTV